MIQHPELDGPFNVGAQANRWNSTLRFFTANTAALTSYRATPSPLSRVWAGDNPLAPAWTIALAFPDATTATTVLTACGAREPTP